MKRLVLISIFSIVSMNGMMKEESVSEVEYLLSPKNTSIQARQHVKEKPGSVIMWCCCCCMCTENETGGTNIRLCPESDCIITRLFKCICPCFGQEPH